MEMYLTLGYLRYTETYTLHRDSSTELCTGATAHTHEDKDHHRGREVAVVQSKLLSKTRVSPGMAQTCDTCQERQLDKHRETPTPSWSI